MKNILITGGSAGIGLALVEKFLSQGYTVFTVSRNPRSLSSIDNENLRYIQADITSDVERKKIISALLNNNVSELSIINNAAYGHPEAFENTSITELRTHFETNFFAPLELGQSLLSTFRIDRFLNVSSGAAEFPLKSLLPYCTSKAAIHHAMKCLNLEYKNTKFANLRPGMVDTSLQERWRNVDESVFPDGNFYLSAKENNQLITVNTVSDYVFWVMSSPLNEFAKDWNIMNVDDQKYWLNSESLFHN